MPALWMLWNTCWALRTPDALPSAPGSIYWTGLYAADRNG